MKISIIFILIISILSAANVYSFGITPSTKIIEYNTEQNILSARIVNNEARDITVKISASGELAQYVLITEPTVYIRSDESEKEFRYVVLLPPNLEPGPKIIGITATAINNNLSENSIGGMVAVTQQLQINVPYTGIYAEGYLSLYPVGTNIPINTMLEIVNRGDQVISSISGTLNVKDADNNTVYSKKIEGYKLIAPTESARIEETFLLTEAGTYNIEYDMKYDNKDMIVKKEFNLGEYNITVLSADVKNFRLGTIAKFDINLLARWNKAIDVYGEISLKQKNGIMFRQNNITKMTINPYNNLLTAYIDTVGMEPGEYILGIKLYAGGEIISREYPAILSTNGIEITMPASTTNNATGKKIDSTYILLCVVLFSILGTLMILLLRKNKKLYK
jgi:hypothetical protein